MAAQPSFINDLFLTTRKPRNYQQWEEVARRNTEDVKTNGSSAPLVWVLVKGKNIPPNAIVAGMEKRKPLYIARSFFEGSLCIGKAGQQLEKGASIPYNGEEVHVDTYEVLVPALEPVIRYRVSTSLHMPTIPRMASEIQPETPASADSVELPAGVARLNFIKIVILIDDSASMAGARWRDAREALAGLVAINGKVSSDGVDLFFMNEQRHGIDVKDPNEVRRLFESVHPRGETPIGEALERLFGKYLSLAADLNHRPITLVTVTDGEPTDEPEPVIVNAARQLDEDEVPENRFGLQFVQIGDDPEASEFLRELDDDLYLEHKCRDIVDATPFNPAEPKFTMTKIVEILLRSTDKSTGEQVGEALSPLFSPKLQLPSHSLFGIH